MAKLPKSVPQISTRDAVLASCLVWRKQGHKFVSTDFPNSNSFILKNLGLDFQDNITQEDRDLTENLVSFLTEDLVMKKLTGVFSEFEQSILTLLSEEFVSISNMGKVAFLPEMYQRHRQREREQEFFKNSQHLGRVGERIETNIFLVRKKIISAARFHRWQDLSATALLICSDPDHNLIKIFHKELDISQNTHIHVKARVKKHDFDIDFGVPCTMLNYVKKIH